MFEYLDRSRHLPGFRLEPHVAPFFGIYMVDILDASNITKPIRPMVIPEFPLRRGEFARFENDTNQNGAKHEDYVAISNDANVAYFIELKTDAKSISRSENQYLYESQELKFHDFVQGIFKIATASKTSKRKYVHLLHQLSQLQLVRVPDDVYDKSLEHRQLHHGVVSGWTDASSWFNRTWQVGMNGITR